ncbi:hypothetical protein [Rhizobium leguminosarum]|uniref:hypothetical protein n=1 Tax=Rhizobium leguminosarum TaxID=384 RepID=UPI001C9873D6|nr:hypothetical protein [Rhizobium leguminosarum]MBY5827672.1 hypothetical protein [Rhizobium leguminosarum]
MAQSVTVYGFGSFFAGAAAPADIDLLIVHQKSSSGSCTYAITCKHLIRATILSAHITMLSEREEKQLAFIEKSGAKPIGIISENTMTTDVDRIRGTIGGLSLDRNAL